METEMPLYGYQEKVLHQRVVRPWNRLHRAVVTAFSLPKLNKHLDNILRHMVWFLGGAMWSQGLDSIILMGPFQLKIFYDSVILWFTATPAVLGRITSFIGWEGFLSLRLAVDRPGCQFLNEDNKIFLVSNIWSNRQSHDANEDTPVS